MVIVQVALRQFDFGEIQFSPFKNPPSEAGENTQYTTTIQSIEAGDWLRNPQMKIFFIRPQVFIQPYAVQFPSPNIMYLQGPFLRV